MYILYILKKVKIYRLMLIFCADLSFLLQRRAIPFAPIGNQGRRSGLNVQRKPAILNIHDGMKNGVSL